MKAPVVRIAPADPQGAEALSLLREAAVEARLLYPELFVANAPWPTNPPLPERGFYAVAYLNDTLVGCGALYPLDTVTVEIRRIFVRQSARRSGVGKALLAHLEGIARALAFETMKVETGHRQHPAIALYKSCGFKPIKPFGEHVHDPTSVCFEKRIA